MQQVAFKLCTDPDTKPSDVAQLMRAHVAAEQQRNILRMRPAPKPIDTTQLRKNKRGRQATAAASDPVALPTPTPVQEPSNNS